MRTSTYDLSNCFSWNTYLHRNRQIHAYDLSYSRRNHLVHLQATKRQTADPKPTLPCVASHLPDLACTLRRHRKQSVRCSLVSRGSNLALVGCPRPNACQVRDHRRLQRRSAERPCWFDSAVVDIKLPLTFQYFPILHAFTHQENVGSSTAACRKLNIIKKKLNYLNKNFHR